MEKNSNKTLKTHPASKYDVLFLLIERVFDLFDTRNIVGVVVVIILVILLKQPSEFLDKYISEVIGLLKSERYYIIPMGMAIAFPFFFCNYHIGVYKEEIKRLVEERSELMHGFKTGIMKELPPDEHRESGYDPETDK